MHHTRPTLSPDAHPQPSPYPTHPTRVHRQASQHPTSPGTAPNTCIAIELQNLLQVHALIELLCVRAKQGAQGGCSGRAKHVCPRVPKVFRPKKIAASYHWYDAARRRPVRWNPTPRSPTLHDATNSQPRRSNNKVTLFSVNVTVNFL